MTQLAITTILMDMKSHLNLFTAAFKCNCHSLVLVLLAFLRNTRGNWLAPFENRQYGGTQRNARKTDWIIKASTRQLIADSRT